MLPTQMQAVIMEQNKLVLDRFYLFQKQPSLTYSGANSLDGEVPGSVANLIPGSNIAGASGASVSTTSSNVLQIPTIATRSS
jgi:hypothetical protein